MMWAAAEARHIAGLLRARPLIWGEADRQNVLELLPGASVAHFATHAYFVPGAPVESGIRLADGDLTARELAGRGLSAGLIVLSACETGRAESLGGDEMAGLAMALLQAGARSVLASLWPVSGCATATLMSSFYEAWQRGSDKAAALAHAMAELRLNGWDDPSHWGAFALFGDWRGDPPSHLPPAGI
jgi:CHAT domain-containing protein